MESQWNKRLKSTRLILQIPKSDQVVDTMVSLFDMAIEHCAVGLEPDLVSRLMDLDPLGRIGFVLADLVSNLGMEYFGSTTGHAPEPRVSKIAKDFLQTLFR
jgi:hypothetical protein